MNIRPMREGDVNFVISTWLKSYYEALKWYASGSIRVPYPKDDVFFKGHQLKIKKHLEDIQSAVNNGTKCSICVAPDEDNQIIGWIVYDKDAIHYCYVKHVFRKMGVGRALVKLAGNTKSYSHHTKYSRYLNSSLEFNPYKF